MTAATERTASAGLTRAQPGVLARAWARLRFRDAFLISLVPVVAVLLILGSAMFDYSRARQFDDWYSKDQTVAGAFSERVHALKVLPGTLSLRHGFDPDARDAGIIRLTIPGRVWDSLQADPLAMWGQWVDGKLHYGETTIDVSVRKRGDNSVHWLTDKRSLTIRTPKDEFYKRYRQFALSVKDVLPAYTANRMAQEFGILAPTTEVVPVYLNNRFFGMFRFEELPSEGFLRPFDEMPGNIFRADRAERAEYFKGLPRNVFENLPLWDRTAKSDRWTGPGSGALALLLRDLHGETFEDHLRLMQKADPEEFQRLFAYLFVVGDPYHMDNVHNQLIYEDSWTELLHPIPWDIRLLDLSRPQHPLNDWFRAVLSDPFVVDGTMREVARRVTGDATLRTVDSLTRSVENRYKQYFEYDRRRIGLVPDVGSADEVVATVRKNIALLRRWTADSRVAFHASGTPGGAVLDFETRGLVGADLTALSVDRRPASTPVLRLDKNLDGVLDPSDPAVPLRVEATDSGARLVLTTPVALYAGWNTTEPGVKPGHIAYRLFVSGLPAGATLSPVLINRATSGAPELLALEAGVQLRAPTAWHPWRYPASVGKTHRLSGQVRLDETLKIPATDTLVIEPGTTILLAPDVSIIARGLVRANGTAERRIRVLPQIPGKPWGTFALQGPGASGSSVTYAEFAQGGGSLVDRIEYTGQVVVHHAERVTFDHDIFRDNLRSDDNVHILKSSFAIRNSHFQRSNSDALDLDISKGDVLYNVFDTSGNDALDLMTSAPRIIGNVMRASDDKGISIGEASRPFIFNNLIDHCNRGIEVKDRSEPIVLNNEFVGNKVGFRERRKNWQYGGGGWPTFVNTIFVKNKVTHLTDPFSRMTGIGLVGLDSTSTVDSAGDLRWFYARYGLRVDHPAPGRVTEWSFIPPVPPMDEDLFEDDFGPVSDGWEPSGGTTRLEKRRDVLTMEVERSTGVATRRVDWMITGPDSATLVFEAQGRDIDSVRIVAGSDRGRVVHVYQPDNEQAGDQSGGKSAAVARGLQLSENLHTFHYVIMRVPPGHYTSLSVEAIPRPGLSHIRRSTGLSVLKAGRLEFRGFALYPGQAAPAAAALPTP
jgi:parallel beta-helix repeat protein